MEYKVDLRIKFGLSFLAILFFSQTLISPYPAYLKADDFLLFDLDGQLPFLKNINTDEKISRYVETSDGKVLVEHASFSIMNERWTPPDVSGIHELQRNGFVDKQTIEEYCREKNFSLIIYYHRLDLIDGFRECIDERYELIDELPWYNTVDYDEVEWKVYKLKS
jgi:hypothetical protein